MTTPPAREWTVLYLSVWLETNGLELRVKTLPSAMARLYFVELYSPKRVFSATRPALLDALETAVKKATATP